MNKETNPLSEGAHQQLAVVTAPSFMDLIAQNINNPDFDVAKLNALIDANIRVNEIQAKIDFNEAMARLQPRLPQIVRNAKGHNATYATYESMDYQVRPLYTAEGFSVSYDTKGQTHYGFLSHKGGFTKTAQIDFSPDNSGNKNTPQAIISALSYAKRQLLAMLLNIVTKGEDDDGIGGAIDDMQAKYIKDLLKETESDVTKFLAWIASKTVKEIPYKSYQKATRFLEKKKQKGQRNANIP